MTRYDCRKILPGKETFQICSSRHVSLDDMTQHLLRDFPDLELRTVAREVARAVAAAKWVGIADDEALMIELVARAQLELRAGNRVERARLDTENHPGRRNATAVTTDQALAIA